jgi:hypothetical protein
MLRLSHTVRRALPAVLMAAVLLLPAGCAWWKSGGDARAVAAIGHNPVSLSCYKAGRIYSAQGRYELAREQYLLAYAAAEGDSALRADLERELTAVDMMIRTLR